MKLSSLSTPGDLSLLCIPTKINIEKLCAYRIQLFHGGWIISHGYYLTFQLEFQIVRLMHI